MFKRRKLGKAGTRPTGTEMRLGDSNCVIDECTEESVDGGGDSGISEVGSEDCGDPQQGSQEPSEVATIHKDLDLDNQTPIKDDSASPTHSLPQSSTTRAPSPSQPKSTPRARKIPTIVHDLQPNICKEYHKTGYCSYGDSCKFAHIRDLHPAKPTRTARAKSPPKVIGVNCSICHKDPVQPAKAKCGHRFCLQCFLSTKPKNCPACNAETNGSVSVER